MWEWIKKNENNPIFGTICWPLSTWLFYNRAEYGMVIFCAFCAGISIDRFLSGNWTKPD